MKTRKTHTIAGTKKGGISNVGNTNLKDEPITGSRSIDYMAELNNQLLSSCFSYKL